MPDRTEVSKENILLARQPIYDPKKEIYGYELLFRSNEQLNPEKMDGNIATSQVLLNAFTESDLSAITANHIAFVNFTRELISSPPPFSPDMIVVEILENIEIDQALIEDVKKLKMRGYKIALDDFVMDDRYLPLLPFADIIKLELPAMTDKELQQTVKFLGQYSPLLLAEKVETHQEFKRCKELGCNLFQGYFLSRPEIIKGKTISKNKLTILKLVSEVQNPQIDIPSLIDTINRDPALSFSLLKLMNSAAYRRPKTITSIHMAVMLLGVTKVKSWACLLALGKMDDKPQVLRDQALIRARMCELMSEQLEPDKADSYFMMGLLSCLGLFFDTPLKDILLQIPLTPTLNDALVEHKGRPGLAIHSVAQYEQNKWDNVHWELLARFDLTNETMNHYFVEAIKWTKNHDTD
jgi:EAL and modified HD-GYP domain-containing signal transduction protein